MNQAYDAWYLGDGPRTIELLESLVPRNEHTEDLRHFEWHYLWRLTSTTREAKRFQSDYLGENYRGISCVAVSPDGKVLAWATGSNVIRVVNLINGETRFERTADNSWINCVRFSPDGRQLATGGIDDRVRIWNAKSGELEREIELHSRKEVLSGCTWLEYSPDGSCVAVAGASGTVTLWNASTGKLLNRFDDHDGPVSSIDFSPDANRLFTVGADGQLCRWDLKTGDSSTIDQHGRHFTGVRISPDGKWLAVGTWDGIIRLWTAHDERFAATFRGHDGLIRSLAFSRDSKLLVSGGQGGHLAVWDLTTGTQKERVRIFDGPVSSLCFLPGDQQLVASTAGKAVLIDANSGQQRATFDGPSYKLKGRRGGWSFAVTSDEKYLAVSDGLRIKTWNLETGFEEASLAVAPWHFRITLSPNDRWLVVNGYGRNGKEPDVKVVDLFTGASLDHLQGRGHGAFSRDGSRFATGDIQKPRIRIIDVDSGDLIQEVDTPFSEPRVIEFVGDDRLVSVTNITTTGVGNYQVTLWDLVSGTAIRTIEPVRNSTSTRELIRRIQLSSPDGSKLLTVQSEGTLRVWSTRDGCHLSEFQVPTGVVSAASFSADGNQLAVGTMQGDLYLFDTLGNAKRQFVRLHLDEIATIEFSHDGNQIVTSGADNIVRVWDLQSDGDPAALLGHQQGIIGTRIVSNGESLISVGRDCMARLWDLADTRLPRELSDPPAGPVKSLAFSPDGTELAAGGREVRRWSMPGGEPIASRDDGSNSLPNKILFYDRHQRLFVTSLRWEPPYDIPLQTPGSKDPTYLKGHSDIVKSISLSASGTRLATAALLDGVVRVFDTSTGNLLTMLDSGDEQPVLAVEFSPHDRRIAVSAFPWIEIWDWKIPRRSGVLRAPDNIDAMPNIRFSRDGRYLVGGTFGGLIVVWDVDSESVVSTINDRPAVSWSFAFSPDGQRLASAEIGSKAIRLWETTTGNLVGQIPVDGGVRAIEFSPTEDTLAYSTGDGRIVLCESGRSQGSE